MFKLLSRLGIKIVFVVVLLLPVNASASPNLQTIATLSQPTSLNPVYSGNECNDSWLRLTNNLGSHFYVTQNGPSGVNSAEWRPNLPYTGSYRVEFYDPSYNQTRWPCPYPSNGYVGPGSSNPPTNNAQYRIHHAGGTTQQNMGQVYNNTWRSLGVYSFNAGTSHSVTLNDSTGEPNFDKVIAFSAMRFVYVGTSSVSGQVLDTMGNPVSGVTVSTGGSNATTDGNGNYTITGLGEGSYTLTPSKEHYTFSPPSRGISVPPNRSAQNFIGTYIPPEPDLDVSPASLTFGTQIVDTVGPSQAVTVLNDGNASMTIDNISTSAGFSVIGNTCPAQLAIGASCMVDVAFAPTQVGNINGTLTVETSAPNSPQTVTLSGTAEPVPAPSLAVSPTSLTFGLQTVGTISPSQAVTVLNAGNAPMTINNISISGSFQSTNTCPAELALGASCTVDVSFVPTQPGNSTGTLTVETSAPNSPQTVNLSGAAEWPPLCQIENLAIDPAYPNNIDSLTLTYTCAGLNDVLIRWTRNDKIQSSYEDAAEIPNSATRRKQEWCALVTPYRGNEIGAPEKICVNIHDGNIPPEVRNIAINPDAPLDNSALNVNFEYYDHNNDSQDKTKTQIRWLVNGQSNPAFNDTPMIPATETSLEQRWCASVRVHDGRQYGKMSDETCVMIGTGNKPPEVRNPIISPVQPTTDNALNLTFIYFDAEGNSQAVEHREIRWYRNDQLEPGFNNVQTVPATATVNGDIWYATVQVHDGLSQSQLEQTLKVLITDASGSNTLPSLTNLQIGPATPTTDNDLELFYEFLDVDTDTDETFQIYWYMTPPGGDIPQPQPEFHGQTTVPANATNVGESWYAIIIPNDGQGSGPHIYSPATIIAATSNNTPPEVIGVQFGLAEPGDNDLLQVHYTYVDADGDVEGPTSIIWARDGTTEPVFEGRTFIQPELTLPGQRWCVFIIPHDGQSAGEPTEPQCTVIQSDFQNAPPHVENLHILPVRTTSTDDLVAKYTYHDPDGNQSETYTRIRWYRDGDLQPAFIGLTKIPAEMTQPGEAWHVSVEPHDGLVYGEISTSVEVLINTPPAISTTIIRPAEPLLGQTLALEYSGYTDADGDPASLSSPRIRWYQDNVHMPQFDGMPFILGPAVEPVNSQWYATVAPHDGVEYGASLQTEVVTIEPNPDRPSDTYLPVVLVSPEEVGGGNPSTARCLAENYYEDNDSRAEACQVKPGETYIVQPDDVEDVFYFVLTQTASIQIEIAGYQAGEPGQLLLYDGFDNTTSLAAERYLMGQGQIPNAGAPTVGNQMVGKHYIRIYTYPDAFQPGTTYELRFNYAD